MNENEQERALEPVGALGLAVRDEQWLAWQVMELSGPRLAYLLLTLIGTQVFPSEEGTA